MMFTSPRLLLPSPRLLLLALAMLSCSAFIFLPKGEITSKKRTVKLLTYNIKHAAPPSKTNVVDLEAIARVIKDSDPDLVALQEVDAYTQRSGPYNQAEELGKRTGMSPYFFKAIDYDGGEYGVAILSRLPVLETNCYPLPRMEGFEGEPRVLGTALIQLSSKEKILFACTHLDARRDSINRLLQIKAITGLLKDAEVPILIAGDFNAAPGSEVINILDQHFKRTCDPCDSTIPVDEPRRAIDLIAFSPATAYKVKKHLIIPER